MSGCCVLKRPFAHKGAFTCPHCGETSVPLSSEEFRRVGLAIRGMFEREPTEAPNPEAMSWRR